MSKYFKTTSGIFFFILSIMFLKQFNLFVPSLHFINQLPFHNDFFHYYESARRIFTLGGPYCIDFVGINAPELGEIISSATNPPFLTLFLYPITKLDLPNAWMVWMVFLAISSWLSIYLLLLNNRKLNVNILLIATIFSLSGPFLSSYRFAQISPVIFFITTLGMLLIVRDYKILGGALIGLTIALKFFTLPLLAFLWAANKKREAFSALLTALFLSLIPELYTKAFLADWLRCGYPIIEKYVSSTTFNQSIYGLILNVARSMTYHDAQLYKVTLSYLSQLKFGFYLCAFLLAHYLGRLGRYSINHFEWGFGSTILVILALSPLAWTHYFCLAMLPIITNSKHIKPKRVRVVLLSLIFLSLPLAPYAFKNSGSGHLSVGFNLAAWFLTFTPTACFYSIMVYCGLLSYREIGRNPSPNINPMPESKDQGPENGK